MDVLVYQCPFIYKNTKIGGQLDLPTPCERAVYTSERQYRVWLRMWAWEPDCLCSNPSWATHWLWDPEQVTY